MATHKLGDFVGRAYERLRGLATGFERQGNAAASRVLAALRTPALPPPVARLPLEYPDDPVADVPLSIAVAEALRLGKAGDVLAEAERYDLADRVTTDANEVRDAVGRQDGSRGPGGQPVLSS